MVNNKFIVGISALFLLVAVNAREGSFVEDPVCFKDEVPVHPGVAMVDKRGVMRINRDPQFIKNHQGRFSVYLVFDKEECQKAYIDTLTEYIEQSSLARVHSQRYFIGHFVESCHYFDMAFA